MDSLDMTETDVGEIYRAAFADTTDEAFVVVPSEDSVERLVGVLDDLDNPPTVRLLSLKDTFKAVMDDFIVANMAADIRQYGIRDRH
jgi:hypothetical protein